MLGMESSGSQQVTATWAIWDSGVFSPLQNIMSSLNPHLKKEIDRSHHIQRAQWVGYHITHQAVQVECLQEDGCPHTHIPVQAVSTSKVCGEGTLTGLCLLWGQAGRSYLAYRWHWGGASEQRLSGSSCFHKNSVRTCFLERVPPIPNSFSIVPPNCVGNSQLNAQIADRLPWRPAHSRCDNRTHMLSSCSVQGEAPSPS